MPIATAPSLKEEHPVTVSESTHGEATDKTHDVSSKKGEKIIQIVLLLSTLCLAYNKFSLFEESPEPFGYRTILRSCSSIAALFVSLIIITSQTDNGDNSTATTHVSYPFETVYAFYLPFMLTLLFNKRVTVLNSVLALNTIHQSPLLRFLTQFSVVCFTDYNPLFAATIIAINMAFNKSLKVVSELKSLDIVDCNLFSTLLVNILCLPWVPNNNNESSVPILIVRGTLLALLSTVLFNTTIDTLMKRLYPAMFKSYWRSLILFTNVLLMFPFLINTFIELQGIETPIIWLVTFITQTRTRELIFSTWLLCLLIVVPTMIKHKAKLSLNTSRKLWHFMIFTMIVVPFRYDSIIVKIALAGIIPLFLCVEYLRYLKLQPWGSSLDNALRQFADYRDRKGPLIVSYIYLILGVSVPLLLFDSPAGLVSLGIGDAFASIVGKKLGRWRWPGGKKTVEGTAAFVLCSVVVTYLLKQFLGYYSTLSMGGLFVSCLMSGVLEGNSVLNDNILVPSFMLICERLLSS